MDEDELRRAGEGEPTVDHIDVAAFDAQEKMREWLRVMAPAFLEPIRITLEWLQCL